MWLYLILLIILTINFSPSGNLGVGGIQIVLIWGNSSKHIRMPHKDTGSIGEKKLKFGHPSEQN